MRTSFSSSPLAQIKICDGNGDGTFSGPTNYDRDFDAYDFKLADVNGDGKLDIVGAADGPIWSMLNLGGGQFGPQVFHFSDSLSGFKLALADFFGDGKLDVAVVNASGGDVQIGLGNGTGTFTALQVYQDVSFATSWIAPGGWHIWRAHPFGQQRPDPDRHAHQRLHARWHP